MYAASGDVRVPHLALHDGECYPVLDERRGVPVADHVRVEGDTGALPATAQGLPHADGLGRLFLLEVGVSGAPVA